MIGEAVKNLTPETRESPPEIPWTDIAGLRDLIANEYFRIDIHRVPPICSNFYEGWTTGFEPATAWTTTRSSTS